MISETLMARVADRLRVLGQPVRLRLVELLSQAPSTPQELGDALGLSQQNVSKHLLTLHRAGIVSRRPEGVNVIYELSDRRAMDILGLAVESVTAQLQELSELATGIGPGSTAGSSERPPRRQWLSSR